ncbi:MAG TPA: TetR/AcrR family transcriptional regulator [Acidimicrobiales bacterium]
MTFSQSAYGSPHGASGPGSSSGDAGGSEWQARALHRSLERARTRSVERMERLVTAARELADETGTAAFTVTQVTERAGLSLKSFYRCFPGKDELLIALLEEDTRLGASMLAEAIAPRSQPVERLRAYVDGLFEFLTLPGALGYAGLLVREHRRLAEGHPAELRAALAPLIDMLAAELAAVGPSERVGRDPSRAAETIFGVLLSGINDVTLGRAEPREVAVYLWQFCWAGVRGDS